MTWSTPDGSHPQACLTVQGEKAELALAIDDGGRFTSIKLQRWGNPGGAAYRYWAFGGFPEAEATFDGYTIPAQLRIGWHFGTERFESDGEFFRVTVDDARFR